MSLNGLSIVSSRAALQPCVSVFMVWGIREKLLCSDLTLKMSAKITLHGVEHTHINF